MTIKMRYFFRGLFLLCIMTCMIQAASAQEAVVDPADSLFNLKYAGFDFKGNFAAKATSDEVNNYYLVDMTKLSGRFGRVYFMNEMFRYAEVFNIDPAISRDKIWFQSNKRYPEKEILDLLNAAMKKTGEVAGSYTEPEKTKWLKENDKYK